MDDKTQRRLSDLREALFAAIAESDEVRQVWQELKDRGYSLYLLLENRTDLDDESNDVGSGTESEAGSGEEPKFQINGSDLSFLRSVGIDPTRRPRGGRG